MNKQAAGFTLIELMIVVVIIGILAMIAYPSYQESLTKTRRTDGQSHLMSIINAQERFYTENNTYTTDLTDLGYASATDVASEEGFYEATAAACTALASLWNDQEEIIDRDYRNFSFRIGIGF